MATDYESLSDHQQKLALHRLKREWLEQARNALLIDLAAKLEAMVDEGCALGAESDGWFSALDRIEAWMNEQATTEGTP